MVDSALLRNKRGQLNNTGKVEAMKELLGSMGNIMSAATGVMSGLLTGATGATETVARAASALGARCV